MQINIWSYAARKLLHSIETGHSGNIFCTKFIPETSDELVASGAGDAEVIFKLWLNWVSLVDSYCIAVWYHCNLESINFSQVRLFNLSRVSERRLNDGAITPSGLYQCHTRRVKKLAVRFIA